MKYTLSISDCSKEEIQGILERLSGGTQVTVASTATTVEKEEEKVDESDLNNLKKDELKTLCDERALAYSTRDTKQDLIDLLEGRKVPAQEEVKAEPTVEVPPVIDVPQAQPTPVQAPINEAPAVVQQAPVQYDQGALINQFTEVFNNAKSAGVGDTDLQNCIAFHLQNLGHSGQKLSQIPVEALATFVPMFSENCNTLVANLSQGQGQGQNNSYI